MHVLLYCYPLRSLTFPAVAKELSILRTNFQFPVDGSPGSVLTAILSKVLLPRDHLEICGQQDFESALEADISRSAAHESCMLYVPILSSYEIYGL